MGGWDDFDYDLTVEHVSDVQVEYDPVTYLPIEPTPTTTVIQGSVDYDAASDEERSGNGLVKEGDAVLYTSADLAIGDRINVPLTPSITDVWRVKGVESNYRFIHSGETNRLGYILEREADG